MTVAEPVGLLLGSGRLMAVAVVVVMMVTVLPAARVQGEDGDDVADEADECGYEHDLAVDILGVVNSVDRLNK